MAIGINHQLNSIGKSFSKMAYGDNLLVTARNIASKEVLHNEEDKLYYIKLKNELAEKEKNNDLISIIGYDESYLSTEGISNIRTNVGSKSVKRNGVCFSANMYLAGKILNSPNIDEETLIKCAQEFHKGVPAEVAAKQEIFHELKFCDKAASICPFGDHKNAESNFRNVIRDLVIKRALEHYSGEIPNNFSDEVENMIKNIIQEFDSNNDISATRKLDFRFKVSRNDVLLALYFDNATTISARNDFKIVNEAASIGIDPKVLRIIKQALKDLDLDLIVEKKKYNAIAHLYGFRQDFEGTGKANSIFGDYSTHESSKSHLKNFSLLDTGVYETNFSTGDSSHSVLYVKLNSEEGYLFDPNYGLIRCDQGNHAKTYLKLLSLYTPPAKKLENESDERNYRFAITKHVKK